MLWVSWLARSPAERWCRLPRWRGAYVVGACRIPPVGRARQQRVVSAGSRVCRRWHEE